MENEKFIITQDIETANDLLGRGLEPILIKDHSWYFSNNGKINFSDFNISKLSFTNILPM